MKILVTGGAGFIASHIVDAYIREGHDVFVLDNLSSGKREFINPKATFYQSDIRDKKEIETIIKKVKPDVINHHAAQISVRSSVEDPINDAEINIAGLLNLLEFGRQNGVKKIIFASSGGVVYGEAKTLPTSEDYLPLFPISPYGISKLTSEFYLNFYFKTYRINFTALRYANVYGPRQNPHGEAGVVAIFTLKLLKNEIPTINGSGIQTRDYVFVGDVVEANKLALDRKITGSLNIGTSIETNVNEIFDNLKIITGSNIKAVHGPAKIGEQQRSCLDFMLAQKILGWQPKVSLEEGLSKTVEYFKKYGKR